MHTRRSAAQLIGKVISGSLEEIEKKKSGTSWPCSGRARASIPSWNFHAWMHRSISRAPLLKRKTLAFKWIDYGPIHDDGKRLLGSIEVACWVTDKGYKCFF
jgi:hypothetical protein